MTISEQEEVKRILRKRASDFIDGLNLSQETSLHGQSMAFSVDIVGGRKYSLKIDLISRPDYKFPQT